MSLDADTIVDRRRMRRKLTFWRTGAILIAIVAVVGLAIALVPGRQMHGGGDNIARNKVQGQIRGNQQRA
ncbi:MAG: signal peptide peptidase SppA, partial [Xanthobacteraceae bacterium]